MSEADQSAKTRPIERRTGTQRAGSDAASSTEIGKVPDSPEARQRPSTSSAATPEGDPPAAAEFVFKGRVVRTVIRDGQPWFVGSEVCAVLEISNPRDALSRLDDDEKGVGNTDNPGGQQEVNVISESGLYALILTSRKPQAKAFRRWVTGEVLPSIRRTGSYNASSSPGLQNIPVTVRKPTRDAAAFTGTGMTGRSRQTTASGAKSDDGHRSKNQRDARECPPTDFGRNSPPDDRWREPEAWLLALISPDDDKPPRANSGMAR